MVRTLVLCGFNNWTNFEMTRLGSLKKTVKSLLVYDRFCYLGNYH